jgi:hypothetical protein
MSHKNKPCCICKQISFRLDNNARVLTQHRKARLYEALEICHTASRWPSGQGLPGLWRTNYHGRTERSRSACIATYIALARVHELHSSGSIHLRRHRRFEPLRMHCARNNKRALSYTSQGSSDTVTAHAFVRAPQSMTMMMMASPTPVHTTKHHPEPTSITEENSPSELVCRQLSQLPEIPHTYETK